MTSRKCSLEDTALSQGVCLEGKNFLLEEQKRILLLEYRVFLFIRWSFLFFFPSKTFPKISICRKTCIIVQFQNTDFVICSHSRKGKTLSYSQINTVANSKELAPIEMGDKLKLTGLLPLKVYPI